MVQWSDTWFTRELMSTSEECPGLSEESAQSLLNWAKAARERKPVLLVGAGMSRNAQPAARWREREPTRADKPEALTWAALAKNLKEGLTHDGEELESDALWLAELYAQRYGREALIREVRRAVPDHLLDPGPAYQQIFGVDWSVILTTNYDNLIERAHHKFQIPSNLKICKNELDLVRSVGHQGELELIHLHGVLDLPESIVLSQRDYLSYNKTHAGMLTKVRQLFLQNPVLLVGFSATDPNFVQWSHWLEDLVGEFRNPWINLAVGRHVSRSRQTYWQGALEFISVHPEQLTKILRILGTFGRGLDSAQFMANARGELRSSRSIEHLLDQLTAHLRHLGGKLRTDKEMWHRKKLVEAALRRAFDLRYESGAESKWGEASGAFPVGTTWSSQTMTSNHLPTHREKIQIFQDVLRNNWPQFLLIVAKEVGGGVLIGQTYISILDELESLPSDIDQRLLQALKVQLLQTKIDREPTSNPRDTANEFMGELSCDDILKQEVEDVIRRNLLRRAIPDANENQDNSAQGLRRRGYFAAQAANFKESARHYTEGAIRSREECEDEFVEWLTLISAHQMTQAASFFDGEVSQADDSVRHDLVGRRKCLELKIPDQISGFTERECNAYRELVEKARKTDLHRAGEGQARGRAGSNAMIPLEFLENIWASPWMTALYAEVHAQFEWAGGYLNAAIGTLCRYGSELIGVWIEKEFNDGRGLAANSTVIDCLLKEGRWLGEWLSRAEALRSLIPECSPEQANRLTDWLGKFPRPTSPHFTPCLLRGSQLSRSTEAVTSIIQTQLRLLKIAGPSALRSTWDQLRPYLKSNSLLDTIVMELRFQPWIEWLDSGLLLPSDADQILSELLSEMHPRLSDPWVQRNETQILELISSLWLQESRQLLPKDGHTAELVNTWLGNTAFLLDGRQWLRSILAQSLFSPDRSWSLSALVTTVISTLYPNESDSESIRSESDADSRRLLDPDIRAALLNSLAQLMLYVEIAAHSGLLRRLKEEIEFARQIRGGYSRSRYFHAVIRVAMSLQKANIAHGPQVSEIIRVCIVEAPDAIPVSLEIGRDALGMTWPIVLESVSRMFFNTSASAQRDDQRLALAAMATLLRASPKEVPPHDWWYSACALVCSDDPNKAISAITILAEAAESSILSSVPVDLFRQWSRALYSAAADKRAEFRGLAGYALMLGIARLPEGATEEERAKIRQTVEGLRNDLRMGVQAKMALADHKIRQRQV